MPCHGGVPLQSPQRLEPAATTSSLPMPAQTQEAFVDPSASEATWAPRPGIARWLMHGGEGRPNHHTSCSSASPDSAPSLFSLLQPPSLFGHLSLFSPFPRSLFILPLLFTQVPITHPFFSPVLRATDLNPPPGCALPPLVDSTDTMFPFPEHRGEAAGVRMRD